MKKTLLLFLFVFTISGFCSGQIVFTELNYGTLGTDDSDYLELYNNSGADINMAGYRFDQGFEFTFPDMMFPADSYMVLTVNAISMMETYGVEAIQWAGGSLGAAEDILLSDPNGNEIDYINYNDDFEEWAPIGVGVGYAIQLCDFNSDNSIGSNWQATNTFIKNEGNRAIYGTPGQPNNCLDGPLITTSRKVSRIIEGETPDTATFVFYLENSNGISSSVNISIDPASTASADDYNIINTDVVFDGVQDSVIFVTISTNDDSTPEASENIILNIEAGDNVVKSLVDQVEVIIYDNDRALDRGLVIVGVFDADIADNPSAFDNYGIELFAIKDIPDLSKYSVGTANNGGGTDGIEIALPAISLNKRDNFFISDSEIRFLDFFGIESDLAHPDAFITGDDAVELFEDGVVIDIFGEIDVDGTDTAWEFSDGWAQRISDSGPDGTEFNIDNWFFSGVDFLVGPTNSQCLLPYFFDTYMYTSTEDINVNDYFQVSPTMTVNTLSIDFSNPVNSGTVMISNSQGALESKINIGSNTQSINLQTDQLSAGLYYLTVTTEQGIGTKRFMKI